MKKIFTLFVFTTFVNALIFSQTWKNYPFPESYDSVFTVTNVALKDSTYWIEAATKLIFESGRTVFFKRTKILQKKQPIK